MKRFARSLIAVVSGNALYFLLLPYLPGAARHEPYRMDWGLLVDLWFCVAIYGLLGLVKRFRTTL